MAINRDVFLGSGANLALVPETDLIFQIDASESSDLTNLHAVSGFLNNYSLVEDIYIGCVVDFYDANVSTTVPASSHIITGNDSDSITISPSIASTVTLASDDSDFVIIRSYGAPCVGQKNGTVKRLNADNWLGVLESATFPDVEVELKGLNLSLGTTRNKTFQYKATETASGGNLNIVANHGAFLYYALGNCSHVKCTTTAPNPSNHLIAAGAGDVYIDNGDAGGGENTTQTHLSQGPIFYKTGYGATGTKGTALTPPLLYNLDLTANVETLTRPTTTATAVTAPITYTFTEANGEELPSFSLEQTFSKLPSGATFITGDTSIATESHNFVRIARGNRVESLSLTANENEELKMSLSLNSRAVHKLKTNESYEARGGAGDDNSKLFNFEDTADDAEFLEPFFFSSGSFSIFGEQFLKITNLTLNINNTLQDKRFVGIGSKQIKSAIPAERMYELSFTAMVTDNALFEELFNATEATGTTVVTDGTSNGLIQLLFNKGNTEEIKLQFKNYHIRQANFTVPDDKGPITVEATVVPRDLHLCEVKTHWVLQG